MSPREEDDLLLLVLLLAAVVRAACPPDLAPPASAEGSRALVARGDLAWIMGDRGAARCAWRLAAGSSDPASAAMGHLRRLRTSGNLGLAVHGPRADRALADCPVDDPWCGLARADRDLIITELGLGQRAAAAGTRAAELADSHPEAAAVRALWAGLPVAAISLPAGSSSAWSPVASALVERGGAMPTGPGTWLLGVGVIGASGLGVGPLVRFSHPDLAWRGWQLDTEAWLTSAGAGRARVGLRTTGRWWLTTGAAAGRSAVPIYDETGLLLADGRVGELQARAGPGVSIGPIAAWLGPVARWDLPQGSDGWTPGHGTFGGVALGARRARLTLSAELALTGPDHLAATADLQTSGALLGGTGALRLVGSAAPLPTSPAWRAPAWGAGQVLRAAPLGRLREPWMAAVVPEWRRSLVGPLGVVLFTEGATTGTAVHGGAGAGLRLLLPPQPLNTVRVDVAAGDLGWALSAGWGEAF